MRYYRDPGSNMQPTVEVEEPSTASKLPLLTRITLERLLDDNRHVLPVALQYLGELCEAKVNYEDDDCLYWSSLGHLLKIASDRAIF